ncbi:MAG TPA: DUF3105 domain-containing protein [Jiangellaceae bacterium]|nr:DUF3105 domain-containing protein [Jiangellaceae bacterium]
MAKNTKKPAKKPETARREKLEALRREQQRSERRRTTLFVGIAIAVALGLIAAAAVPLIRQWLDDPTRRDWADFGVTVSAASCDAVTEEEQTGSSDHRQDGERIDYASAPPTSGPHYQVPAPFTRKFYTPDDSPEIERLVHNLEHGYTILWYDPAVLDANQETMQDLATKVTDGEDVREQVAGKFIVAPWDSERGAFPDGMSFALTHWGAEQGFRQYCGELSGEVVRDFVTAHPFSDAPEPNAA